MKCHYCATTTDLRPYGHRGSMVCFDCAMSTPGRKKETAQNFAVQLDAINGPALLDGSEVGPYPAKHYHDTQWPEDVPTGPRPPARCDNCNTVVTQGEAKTLFCSGEINGVQRHVISLCPSCVPTKKDRGAA